MHSSIHLAVGPAVGGEGNPPKKQVNTRCVERKNRMQAAAECCGACILSASNRHYCCENRFTQNPNMIRGGCCVLDATLRVATCTAVSRCRSDSKSYTRCACLLCTFLLSALFLFAGRERRPGSQGEAAGTRQCFCLYDKRKQDRQRILLL